MYHSCQHVIVPWRPLEKLGREVGLTPMLVQAAPSWCKTSPLRSRQRSLSLSLESSPRSEPSLTSLISGMLVQVVHPCHHRCWYSEAVLVIPFPPGLGW